MPASDTFNQSHIAEIIGQYDCQTALEVGIGWGNIGTYLKGIFPHLRIDGIEIWAKYNNQQWANYTSIQIADFCAFPITPFYDTILVIDVIEHLNKNKALYQIERLKKLALKVCVLSIPIIPYPP